jgi:hypothetical protein
MHTFCFHVSKLLPDIVVIIIIKRDQIYTVAASETSRPRSPAAGNVHPPTPLNLTACGHCELGGSL